MKTIRRLFANIIVGITNQKFCSMVAKLMNFQIIQWAFGKPTKERSNNNKPIFIILTQTFCTRRMQILYYHGLLFIGFSAETSIKETFSISKNCQLHRGAKRVIPQKNQQNLNKKVSANRTFISILFLNCSPNSIQTYFFAFHTTNDVTTYIFGNP